MIQKIIEKLIRKINLSEDEMIYTMNDIMEGKCSDAQISGLLMGLRMKGETVEEITGSAKLMRIKSNHVDVHSDFTIDTCGTGGDGANTFNISTTVSFIAAAAGVPVVKHGNRSVSSRCGSADVLEALGVNIQLEPEEVQRCVEECNLGFMFAPNFNPAMKYAARARKELGVRTIFNVLGPLVNPAKAKGQVLGVFDADLTHTIAEVLNKLEVERALVVHGMDGLDEITTTRETKISKLENGRIEDYFISPEDFGLERANSLDLVGGDAQENARILKEILQGKEGAKRDIVLLNAAAAIYVGKKANSIEEGLEIARSTIDEGLAFEKLLQLIALSKEVKCVSKQNCRL